MPLARGIRLGPYEIVAPIGEGGKGEVYKARDTRLDRMVAIKVSHAIFSERFEREARATAQIAGGSSEPIAAVGNPPTHEANRNRSAQGPPERKNKISHETQDRESGPEDLPLHNPQSTGFVAWFSAGRFNPRWPGTRGRRNSSVVPTCRQPRVGGLLPVRAITQGRYPYA
jgi:hypothetical protein